MLQGDKDLTINHIVIEFRRLTQKEHECRYLWRGEMMLRELCQKLNFDHITKSYKHITEFVPENETHEILGDFEI